MAKTVLITGASSGIGNATAFLFAEKGWNVVATMRNPGAALELAALPNVMLTRLDLQDDTSIGKAVAEGIARFDRIDALINNAGFGVTGLFEATTPEKMREQFDVNVFGPMDTMRAVLPHFRAHGGGIIVNLSSGAGSYGLPLISPYCASKFALEGFSESVAHELLSQNIVVKIVTPQGRVTDTSFFERQMEEAASDPALSDYDAYVAEASEAYARRASGGTPMHSRDVAQTIFTAVTDGSTQLRYFTGDGTRDFLKAKREMPDQTYVDFVRDHFRKSQ